MKRLRKTWREKLEIDKARKLTDMPRHLQKRWGTGKLLVPLPLDVDVAIRRIPAGRVMTSSELRAELAREFGADTTCPLCVGMFIRIAAEAAEEAAGERPRVPYWRVVSDAGKLNGRLPGGVKAQAAALRAEGHEITDGDKPAVKGIKRIASTKSST